MNQSKVLVAGTGISGIAAAKLVLERGGEVVLYDGNTALNTDEIRAKFGKDAKVGIVLGEIKRSDLLGVELCIISPGIPLNSGFVAVVDEAGIPVLGEIELAYQCGLGKLAAITGTNGKTTTTSLLGEIMKNAFEMAQKGDSRGVEELARNLCKEKGINPDEAIEKVRQQLGM